MDNTTFPQDTLQKLELMPVEHVKAARQAVDELMDEIDTLPGANQVNQSVVIHALLRTRRNLDAIIERRTANV
jgi:hypothetical protein